MSNEDISKRLMALSSDDTKRSKTKRLTDIIDVVESVLATGVPRSVVIDELASCGLKMTYRSFDSALQRIRKKRGKPSAGLSKPEPKKAASSTIQEVSNKNAEQEPDYDELAGLSAREKRDRRIAQFINEEPTNSLLHFLNDPKVSTVQESKKNDEPKPETENDYDEFAVLSAREKRERRIAEFTTDYKPTNPLLNFLKDKIK